MLPNDWRFGLSKGSSLANPDFARSFGSTLAAVILPPGSIDAPAAAVADEASPAAAVRERDAEHGALTTAFLGPIGGAARSSR